MYNQLFGMPSLVELDTLEDNVRLCLDLGLDFIELNMNLPQFQPNSLDIKRLTEIFNNYGIFFTFHLPEEIDIANFNDKIRKAYIEITKEAIEISKYIGCPLINMHMNTGAYFKMPDSKIYLYEKFSNDFYNNIVDFQKYVDKFVAGSSIKVSIENTGTYKFDYISMAVAELLKSENFSLTWDVGHDHSCGMTDRIFIVNHIKKLRHFHLHDAIGKNNHLPLFTGEIDLTEKLIIAKETMSTCVIETKTVQGLKHSVSELNKLFRNTWLKE